MNLMERLKSLKSMTREEWEELFDKQEREILVLRHTGGGGSMGNGFWIASAYFLAYWDCADETLHRDEGRLVWAIDDEEEKSRDYFGRFANDTIYRVKVRSKIRREGMVSSSQREFLVVEVMEQGVSCRALQEILEEYRRPVVVEDDVLGELELNREFDCLEGVLDWRGEDLDVSLEVNPDNKSTWTKARKAMQTMYLAQDKWDEDMRRFAAAHLSSLACEWRSTVEEPTPEITEASFAERIALRTIAMTAGGTFSAYFSDDDMFFGHSITVRGTLKKGLSSAHIEG